MASQSGSFTWVVTEGELFVGRLYLIGCSILREFKGSIWVHVRGWIRDAEVFDFAFGGHCEAC